ncbi:uncharacterized protein EI90DRAFT_3049552, partial [Cantharellus anzutake]|uniref:uncharacterized protein n=1 Tax=Cantharellus anzutake TaxID=1750568 RepID=UPI001903ED07
MSLHGAEPQWGLGQRPRGVQGTAPMPSTGARVRRTCGCARNEHPTGLRSLV